ncbi:DUF3108 domain-containing protein [Odoribacter sp. OttesenSCG-928-J03]|nr:DUF3108 domain-containing protein [Odoribacter sp. OttesenSCG-928-J03]MDL2283125.1 DUF3108 domain-containing protein [Odoribacter sp. OttesenSCG-928-G04]MDL2330482.1 DUF3108 domain-containing protein [Odoribacter sp. OttesenSCG-928-A06]
MKRAGFVLLLLLCVFSTLKAQKKYAKIEQLTYNGYYNWGFIWMRAGVVDFHVRDSEKYPGATAVEAVGSSLPSWDWVFRLRDTLTCHFDATTCLPYESARKAHEGNYHKTFDYVFDYSHDRILARIERIGRYVRHDTIALKPNTHDMLSIVWLVREVDYDSYKTGDTIPIKLLIDDEIFDLYIRYHGLDSLKVDKKKRECYVFSPLLVEGEVFKKGENMKIWLSRDEDRLPLMVEAKIIVGSVKGILDVSKSIYKKTK